MSILSNAQQQEATEPVIVKRRIRARRRAKTAINGAHDTAEIIARNLVDGLNAIWLINPDYEDGTPQDVLDVIGTDAVELFALSRDTAAYIIPQLTGKRDDLVDMINGAFANMLPYTENEDGTVTVDLPEEEETTEE